MTDLDKIKKILDESSIPYLLDEAMGCVFGIDLRPDIESKESYIGFNFREGGKLDSVGVSNYEEGELFRFPPLKAR